jgi:outer membrane protein assembly factor BamB
MGVNPSDYSIDSTNVDQLTVKWKAQTGGQIYSAPAVGGGKAFVGSNDNKVYAFDATTGTLSWTVLTGGNVRSAPAYHNGTVFVGSADDKVYAIDATTGAVKWTVNTGGDVIFGITVLNGTVYVPSKTGKALYAIDESTGTVKWIKQLYNPTWSSPAVVGNTVYIGWDDRNLYALDASTGKTKWSTTLGAMVRCAPTVVAGVVYVGADNGWLYALNATTGEILWSSPTAPSHTTPYLRSTPAVFNGLVYVASAENTPMAGHIYAFNALTGTLVWSRPLNDYSESAPAIANGIVYVGAEHQLYAFDAITGIKYWMSGEQIIHRNVQKSDPAIAQGQLFVGSQDDYFYSFGIVPGHVLGATISVGDTGIDPDLVTDMEFGEEAEFDFIGPSTHSVLDSNGMGLINSGPRGPGAVYVVKLPGAGNYNYKDGYSSATGEIKVPMEVVPTSGTIQTAFTVRWAAGPPPAGFVYDVQILHPGGTYYLDWKMGTVDPSGIFIPQSGPGKYSFHARVTNAETGRHTDFSTQFVIRVTG